MTLETETYHSCFKKIIQKVIIVIDGIVVSIN
jgi:hypothetical protein